MLQLQLYASVFYLIASALWSGWYIWKWNWRCCWKAGSSWVGEQQPFSLNHNFLFSRFYVMPSRWMKDFIVTSFISLFYVVNIILKYSKMLCKNCKKPACRPDWPSVMEIFFFLSFLPVSKKHNEKKSIFNLHYSSFMLIIYWLKIWNKIFSLKS